MAGLDLRGSAAHVFVTDLERLDLEPGDHHHLARVLRLRAGEAVTVSDGAGAARAAVFVDGRLEPAGDVVVAGARPPSVAVGFALVKGDRSDWIVQKLTECGVDRIVPFAADRSVVRWDDLKLARHAERWRTIARAAAMQSRRLWLPEVTPASGLSSAVGAMGGALADGDGRPPTSRDRGLHVGPEGGWSDAERNTAADRVTLGAQVLRSETAAVAAAVVLTGLRDGVVRGIDTT